MASDQTQEWDRPNTFATPPRFDEEWTVLTARPVVPLVKLKTKAIRVRVLKLAGAFTLAIVLGALTALLTINLPEAANQNAESETVPEQPIVAEAATAPLEVPATFEKSEAEPGAVLAKKTPMTVTAKQKMSATQNEQPTSTAVAESLTADPSAAGEIQQYQTSPDGRFEERRLRRVFRQLRRERAAQRSRGLLRIDEIFEGRRP